MTTMPEPRAARRRGGGRSVPTLSLCVGTSGPADRVHALLDMLRPHVDEIVLAVDEKAGTAALDACADLVDRSLVYELDGSPSRVAGWLVQQCSCDWILRLDDDEVPSAALIDRLPELVADPYPTVYALRRWWLHPHSGERILTPPWGKDWSFRLIRNMPSLWWYAGLHHTEGEWTGDVRYLDEAIYHVDGLVKPEADRRAKAHWYDGLADGLLSFGVPVNHMYTPEDHDVETAPVPEADADAVAALVTPAPAPSSASVPDVVSADLEEIRRSTYVRPVSRGMHAARVELLNSPRTVPARGVAIFEAHVANLGDEVWPRTGARNPHVKLGFRWGPAGQDPHDNGGRVPLPGTVLPGGEAIIPIGVRAPIVPGSYVFEVDLVHEGVAWFGAAQRVEVEVTPADVDRDADWIHSLHELRTELDLAAADAAAARAELAELKERLA